MFNNVALDVFIGLVFVFLLATIVQEISAKFNNPMKCGTSWYKEFRITVFNLFINIKKINPTLNRFYKTLFIQKKTNKNETYLRYRY